jgi:parallel beta-helix repeat protein
MNYKKILLIFLSISIILLSSSTVTADENLTDLGNTIIVDGSSTNQMNEPTIQTAIDNASAGDTIEITGTNYEHCHFIVDKQLTIISNVGTKMSTCPSNIKGSDGIGIFYFNENASGSVLSGFTFSNDAAKRGSVDPYAIYINGASNIEITNCKITQVTDGPGIYIVNGSDININHDSIKKSNKGIYITDSNEINITQSTINQNNEAGIYFGANVENTSIVGNTIYSNNWKGIYYESCVNSNVTSNNISDNRDNKVQSRATQGTGIYVNSSMKYLRIRGNNINQNGNYGIFNSYLAKSSIDEIKSYDDIEKIQEIDENIFVHHLTRCIYTQQSKDGGTYTLYVKSNFYAMETFCPSTYYEPGVLRKSNDRDLVFSEIKELEPGIYNISFVKKHTGEIATYLNTTNITFFLNKATTKAGIEPNDQAKIITVVNGTATVDFTDAKYKSKGNTITAISIGYGAIDVKITTDRLSAIYNVPDENIPNGTVVLETELVGKNLTKYFSNATPYTVTLKDSDGNYLSNQNITMNLNGKDYTRTTDENGTAKMNINLNAGEYNIISSFNGTDDYPPSNTTNLITILPTVYGSDITKMFKNRTQYIATFVDSLGNLIKNESVTFNINGVYYNRITDENGVARLNINLIPGTYIITADNPMTKEKKSNNVTILPLITENKDIVKYYRNGTQYIVKLLDEKGNPLANTNVTFNINGVFYQRTTNESGYAKLNINLPAGQYIITAEYNGCRVSNNITVLPTLIAEDMVKEYDILDQFKVKLVDGEGKPRDGEVITFNINGVFYQKTTNRSGIAALNIRLPVGKYIITSTYSDAQISNTIEVLETLKVAPNLSNNEIQSILDSVPDKVAVRFMGSEYSDISLKINKPILFNGNNTILNAKLDSPAITVNADNTIVKNTKINANNGSGIVLKNVKNAVIENNTINNKASKSNIDIHDSNEVLLKANGIDVSGKNTKILENTISNFKNGIYLKNADTTIIKENIITKNNFGIEFDTNVKNTDIKQNNISKQLGWITFDMVEGPYGYGISVRHSGININIIDNLINENYMGIFLDAENSSGIVITGNEIRESIIEGFTANENYTPSTGATLVVENNALYNNAKGPSLMILGEVSANPAGIYGPGEWDDDLKLQLGPNWYGTTIYTKWGENNTGPGTICPRIKTTLIDCQLTSVGDGKYNIAFINEGKVVTQLPDFTYYFTLNAYTDLQQEVIAYAHDGVATISFEKKNFNSTGNIIEGSSGSLFDSDRPFSVTFTYNVPDSEIPK